MDVPRNEERPVRHLPISTGMWAVLSQCPNTGSPWPFTNPRTHQPFTVNGMAHVFKRALERAQSTPGDVSLHTLRHPALSRMIAAGIDDFTVMAMSGHRSVRMLERYTHPTDERKTRCAGQFRPTDGQKVGRTGNRGSKKCWWTAGGSNSRPPRCERLKAINGSIRPYPVRYQLTPCFQGLTIISCVTAVHRGWRRCNFIAPLMHHQQTKSFVL